MEIRGGTRALPRHRLGAAVDYLNAFGMDAVRAHERTLVDYAMSPCRISPLTIYGPRDSELHGGAVSSRCQYPPHDLRRWSTGKDRGSGRSPLHAATDGPPRRAPPRRGPASTSITRRRGRSAGQRNSGRRKRVFA